MKCFYHPRREAVGFANCSTGMFPSCSECKNKTTMSKENNRDSVIGFCILFFLIGSVCGIFLQLSLSEDFSRDVLDEVCQEIYGENHYYIDQEFGFNKHLYCYEKLPVIENATIIDEKIRKI